MTCARPRRLLAPAGFWKQCPVLINSRLFQAEADTAMGRRGESVIIDLDGSDLFCVKKMSC